MATFDAIVKLASGQMLTIGGVSAYIFKSDKKIFIIEKNGNNLFFNADYVEYIGPAFDLAGSCPELPEF